MAYALRIDNAAVRESHIRRLGGLRAYRDKNKVREALGRLDRGAALFKDDNNSNKGKNVDGDVGGGGGRRLAPAGATIPRIY